MIDYIIVGCGIAGLALAETAIQRKKSILIIDDNSMSASLVAAGIYNPVILKRFSNLHDAPEQLAAMHHFFGSIESRLHKRFIHELPIFRKFASIEEQNLWFAASDKPALGAYLSPYLIQDNIPGINAPLGFGRVNQTGYVNTSELLNSYKSYLKSESLGRSESFRYDLLQMQHGHVIYKDIIAKDIIFAEGFYLSKNPYFNYLPLNGTKGEILTIKADGLPENVIIKAGLFLLPIGNQQFKVGATYEWNDKTWAKTDAAKLELIQKLNEMITVPYEIIDHQAGIRPTVPDRKPLLGTHPKYQNLHILNGLGTRGIMLGPYMAKKLFASIEEGISLDRPIDIRRFE